jgi:hypothetical protein
MTFRWVGLGVFLATAGACTDRVRVYRDKEIPLSRIADLVGLDERTVSRLRLDGVTEERAARYRALDAWIEGRARAVRRDGVWGLEALAQSVPAADIDRAAQELVALAVRMEGEAAWLRQLAERIGRSHPVSSSERKQNGNETTGPQPLLTRPHHSVSLETMNAPLLQSVAESIRTRNKGRMVHFNQKVPPDFQPRLEQAARRVHMTAADFLRALVEVHTEEVSE